MTYKRGNTLISIKQIDRLGKRPSLFIGTETPNERIKVASFGDEEKAMMFCKWLEILLGMIKET